MANPAQLDKYGRPNESTPAQWQATYTDFNAPGSAATNGVAAAAASKPVAEKTSAEDVLSAPPVAPTGEADAEAVGGATKAEGAEKGEKKRKRPNETPEERAERKKKKKERKEKKEKRKHKGKEEANEDSD